MVLRCLLDGDGLADASSAVGGDEGTGPTVAGFLGAAECGKEGRAG